MVSSVVVYRIGFSTLTDVALVWFTLKDVIIFELQNMEQTCIASFTLIQYIL